ncbi:hypothetical protein LTR10_017530 [Elasticomyces elasticus]|uniref:Uncharacterized protein n=1 Tax=Exophiala sideris TaxID=1016849 RepID=A0ABR0IZH5_9EURO|nr:hypothetical protein LTR10_017530 [Elasticomyces elasticus]KAK5023465.1 hypothetical protein LTS07_009340 [Exophiala sideris]KAK5028161.1 hypothetical protein LTR13_009149 [Exophiala sideris]KAK5052818.1 hypothetical protein LTR69_009644 [Exophiala sideris]KAK5178430.1 hypothetical protein LTR44_009055 [Eurotiomycetes sp. CCFEE 6388]
MDKANPTKKPASASSYVSSSGHILETPPVSARISRLGDNIYNFLGLYFVSLFSLDPYTAAQNSRFNLRGRPNAYQERTRWGSANRNGGAGANPGGRGGGSSGFGGTGPGRRMGGIDDVRGPECGSCG